MKVPGKKNKVTQVMIFMETVSSFVFAASVCISLVKTSILLADRSELLAYKLLACMLLYWRIPLS